jgi:hypothetical protein
MLVTLAGSTAVANNERTLPVAQFRKTEHTTVVRAELRQALNQIITLRRMTWKCEDQLPGVSRTKASTDVWSIPQSFTYRVWVAHKWLKAAKNCQRELSSRTVHATNDWLTSVDQVQRIFPGTSDWLRFISDREGGYGQWVWYGGRPWSGYHIGNDFLGADTVGGWMQFRYSTFIVYYHAALEAAKAKGFIIPNLGWARPHVVFGVGTGYGPWLSPLGQALTASYMRYYHKDGCHWCLRN